MEVIRDFQDREVRLTDERLAHILEGHEELAGLEPLIAKTVQFPDIVTASNTNENARLYYRWYDETNKGPKYLCVVVIILIDDAFIASAYLRDRVRRGSVLWEKG